MIKNSTRVPIRKIFRRNSGSPDGINITGSVYGDDYNSPYGVGEYGGFEHFKNISQPNPNHT